MASRPFEPDWEHLLADFDTIHLAVDPLRLERFDFMLDLLEAILPRRFVALDLGSGPGPVAQRILERFPAAQVVMVDHDTALLRVGEEATRRYGARVRALKLDLAKDGWERHLPTRNVDAVVMSNAIYDLPHARVPTLYRSIYSVLRRRGVFLNSAALPLGPSCPALGELSQEVRKVQEGRGYLAPRDRFLRSVERWWEPVRRFEPLREVMARRDAIARRWKPRKQVRSLPGHLIALRRAGFREVGVVWQNLGSACVTLAIK